MADNKTRECPFCRESINSESRKCKFCGSNIEPEKPEHGGTCPFCKEKIKPEATVCRHCRSVLILNKTCECEGTGVPPYLAMRRSPVVRGQGSLGVDGGECTTFCSGSTLWCACDVYVPGIGMGTVIYPCGTCATDPVVTTRRA